MPVLHQRLFALHEDSAGAIRQLFIEQDGRSSHSWVCYSKTASDGAMSARRPAAGLPSSLAVGSDEFRPPWPLAVSPGSA